MGDDLETLNPFKPGNIGGTEEINKFCMKCGKRGKLRQNGWHRNLCNICNGTPNGIERAILRKDSPE